ncbi:MAG: hypothetical protein CYG59_14175 [Chloroflexi bacterium]|nr:MAG: hypothetical protein CYG59_14175 [Chloroflexota bacterium]
MDTTPMIPEPNQPQLVMAIFAEQERAHAAVQALQQQSFANDQLSVLLRHDDVSITPTEAVAMDREAEATGTAVALGGTVGGLAGLLGGLAMFSIPGLGPLFGVGVLATTLGGAALGSAAGERAVHFGGLGLPEERSDRYGSAIAAGEVVVAISAANAQQVMTSREVLALHQADEIDVFPQQPVK